MVVQLADIIKEKALETTSTKADILEVIFQLTDQNPAFREVLGTVSREDIEEVRMVEEEAKRIQEELTRTPYIKKGDTIEVEPVKKMDKIVKLYVKEATREEARYLIDMRKQVQNLRIKLENQVRAINQGYDQDDKGHKDKKQRLKTKDTSTPATMEFRHYLIEQLLTIEKSINSCLEDYSDRIPMGRYAKAIVGIGGTFATTLCAYLEIPDKETLPPDRQVFTVGNWWSYAGLNDNNRPWIKNDQDARNIVKDAIAANNGVIDDNTIALLCANTGWNHIHYYNFCCDKKTGEFKGYTYDSLVKATKMIPYNKDLKKVLYLISESIIRQKNNPNSLYRKLYDSRLEYENRKNENGENAEYAKKCLETKNFSKNTEAYKAYSQGKIPKKQIDMRARRHTEKILLSHLFEFEHLQKFGVPAPVPYVFTMDGVHKDYIGPEVPYEDYLEVV